MPWGVYECGRRGADGACCGIFLVGLLSAFVTRSSFVAGRAAAPMPYRLDLADCQRRRHGARADAVMTWMPGIADKFTQSAQSRLLWPGMTNFDEASAPAHHEE